MATVAENIDILNQYFLDHGEWGETARFALDPQRAMKELMAVAIWDPAARRQFAQRSIFERTLDPPLIMTTTMVDAAIQREMLSSLYDSLTGGLWTPPKPSGITEWIGSEAGGRAYFIAALSNPPRVYTPSDFGEAGSPSEIEMDPEVMSYLLKITRDAALPVSWFGPLIEQQVFKKLEGRIAGAWYSTSGAVSAAARRALLALNAQAQARVQATLAQIASSKLESFPSFPGGDGAAIATVPPPGKRWQRNGWFWLSAGLGLVGGGAAAGRLARR